MYEGMGEGGCDIWFGSLDGQGKYWLIAVIYRTSYLFPCLQATAQIMSLSLSW